MSDSITLHERINRKVTGSKRVWKVLLPLFFVAIIVGVLLLVFYEKRQERASRSVEELFTVYEEWQSRLDEESLDLYGSRLSEDDEPSLEQLEEAVFEAVDRALTEKGSRMTAGKAYFYRARIYQSKGELQEAINDYQYFIDNFSKSYLIPTALYNLAVLLESQGSRESAIDTYQKLYTMEEGTFAALALFNQARLYEASDSYEEAEELYQKLIDNYPDSEWRGFAEARVLVMSDLRDLHG